MEANAKAREYRSGDEYIYLEEGNKGDFNWVTDKVSDDLKPDLGQFHYDEDHVW